MLNLLLAVIYLAFISLGLPDGLLGAAWPSMYKEFNTPVSYAGIISAIIAVGTIVSSLQSDRFTRAIGAGKVTLISVATTAVAIMGFWYSHTFLAVCIWAIPYGLGAGSVDAALNNYVALHFKSRHMSWLHCMWGVGATVGPYIMSAALTSGHTWNTGYLYVGLIQIALTAILFLSLPLWKKHPSHIVQKTNQSSAKPLTLLNTINISGVKVVMLTFFCYCALEATTGLWAASYLTLHRGISAEVAAGYAGLFYMGITGGRAASGFFTFKFNDNQMIRAGQFIIALGVAVLFFPIEYAAATGLILIGLGCAPIYPCIIHSTPNRFGADKSQAVIGVQMASAYVGTCVMPPLFGVLANYISISLFPYFIAALLALMVFTHEKLLKLHNANVT